MSVGTGATTIRCECGKVEMLAGPGMAVTDFRCWECPPAPSKPSLRLVPPVSKEPTQ